MKALLLYLVQVILISGLLYGYYHFFLRNKKFHHYNRYYLLSATILSLFIPFLNIPVYFSQSPDNSSFVIQALTGFSPVANEGPMLLTETNPLPASQVFDWLIIPKLLFLLITSILLLRLMLSLINIRKIIRNNPHEKLGTIEFVNTTEPGTPYSFFRWLFWHRDIEMSSEKGKQIFRHELFHINQKHSVDIVFLEILLVLFYLNPFFWLVKKELRAIHEFLADRYAISENNKWDYAELLLMQTLNTKQSLVNPFFHNQIKRRIAMITTSQKPGHQYLRKLMVLPLTALAIIIFAFNYQYKQKEAKITNIERPFTVVIDAGHGGEDNGAIGFDGTREKNITLAIARKIQALNEDKNLSILLTREDDHLPALKSRTEFTNQNKADLFLSIHVNASSGENQACFEIMSPSKTKNYYSENKILASILMGKLAQLNKAELSQSVKNSVWVLENSDCPSALIECGNMLYEKDLRFISTEKNQDEIAKSILSAIDHYVMQQKSEDWKERKGSVVDTVRPNIILTQYGKDKKYSGTYNGRKVKEILDHESGALVFILENNDMIMISKEISTEIRKKYGYDMAFSVSDEKVKKIDQSNIIFDRVEVEAAFPGGDAKWSEYKLRNLDIAVPINKKAPAGTYTAVVQFVVDKEGIISDFKALTSHGYGMEEEAIRIIREGPRWVPAIQNGKQVKAYKKQPVTFKVEKGQKNFSTIDKVAGNEFYEEVDVDKSSATTDDKAPYYSIKAEDNNSLLVIDGKVIGRMKENRANTSLMNSVHITVLDPYYAMKKYGEQGKNGAWEAYTLKSDSENYRDDANLKRTGVGTIDRIFEKADTPPSFPGGKPAWKRYLEKNANVLLPVNNGAPAGVYKVMVRFIVHEDGSLSDVKAITNQGYEMEAEALRLIKKGPLWIPAKQNGHVVKAYAEQTVTFEVTEDDVTTKENNRPGTVK